MIVEETKRQANQLIPVSYLMLLMEKNSKTKIDNGCNIFLASETITIFVLYLPINNCYYVMIFSKRFNVEVADALYYVSSVHHLWFPKYAKKNKIFSSRVVRSQ